MRRSVVSALAGSLLTCVVGYLLADNPSPARLEAITQSLSDGSTLILSGEPNRMEQFCAVANGLTLEIKNGRYPHNLLWAGEPEHAPHGIVEAGGLIFALDCSRNPQAKMALLRNTVITAGGGADERRIHVRGTVSVPAAKADHPRSIFGPTIVVDSLEVTTEPRGAANLIP